MAFQAQRCSCQVDLSIALDSEWPHSISIPSLCSRASLCRLEQFVNGRSGETSPPIILHGEINRDSQSMKHHF